MNLCKLCGATASHEQFSRGGEVIDLCASCHMKLLEKQAAAGTRTVNVCFRGGPKDGERETIELTPLDVYRCHAPILRLALEEDYLPAGRLQVHTYLLADDGYHMDYVGAE